MRLKLAEEINFQWILKRLRPYMSKIFSDFDVERIGIIDSYKTKKIGDGEIGILVKFIGKDNSKALLDFLQNKLEYKLNLFSEDLINENLKSNILNDVNYIEG